METMPVTFPGYSSRSAWTFLCSPGNGAGLLIATIEGVRVLTLEGEDILSISWTHFSVNRSDTGCDTDHQGLHGRDRVRSDRHLYKRKRLVLSHCGDKITGGAESSKKSHAVKIPAFKELELKVRILMLGFLGFLLSIKSDRYFPLPDTLPGPLFQLLLIPLTLSFFFSVYCFLRPRIVSRIFPILNRVSCLKLAVAISLVYLGMTGILLLVQGTWYASFGYALNLPVTVLFIGVIGVIFVYLSLTDHVPEIFFGTALSAYAGIYLLSIVSFPLHPARSDMLPLIISGCRSVLSGMTPYGYHDIPHHLIFTYLPGMWLPYIPGVAFGIDPRFTSLSCVLLAALVLAWATRKESDSALLLIPVFILTPYLAYRHEIYLGVVFLLLAAAYALYRGGWMRSCGAVFGYALATYQFIWVIFPFFVVSIYRKSGPARALHVMGIGICVALVLILPFFVSAPGLFLEGIYGHWDYFYVANINLAYFISFLVPWQHLSLLQAITVLILLGAAARSMDPADLWGWMAAVLLLFIALNRNIEIYFYLLVLLLLVMHGIAKGGPLELSGDDRDTLQE